MMSLMSFFENATREANSSYSARADLLSPMKTRLYWSLRTDAQQLIGGDMNEIGCCFSLINVKLKKQILLEEDAQTECELMTGDGCYSLPRPFSSAVQIIAQ